jgi:hypothetical protein
MLILSLQADATFADPAADTIEALQTQLRQMQQQMQKMQKKLDELESTKKPAPAAAAAMKPAGAASTVTVAAPPAAATAPAPAPVATAAPAAQPSLMQAALGGQPVTVMRSASGANYMNMSFDAITDVGSSTTNDVGKLQLGDHDPDQRGFSLRNAEVALDGAVDPYFKGFANIVFKLDKGNETSVELEEAYLVSTSLPWNLQVKAGQFFADFGRLNPTHPHTWGFVDEPIIMGRLLGGDGLRNVGAKVSWLAPTPFYTELMLDVFNGEGGTAFSFRDPDNTYGREPVDHGIHKVSDLLFVPRITSSFDLTDTQTLVVGASGAFGPNDTGRGSSAYSEVYGVDTYWKWRPERAEQGFPFVSWQTEGMLRRYEAAADPVAFLPKETFDDYGFYSQVLWGFYVRWVAGLRGEYATGDHSEFDNTDPLERGNRTRVSPNITFYPTEFSKLRLQYNYDHGQVFGDEHSVWVQVEFILGAHGAHKF